MTPTYIAKFGYVTQKTDVDNQESNGLPLVTFEIILADFSVQNKLEKV